MPPRTVRSPDQPGSRPSKTSERTRKLLASSGRNTRPIVPITDAMEEAKILRPKHPSITDDQAALVILTVCTGATIPMAAKQLGAGKRWAYAQFGIDEVRAYAQDMAMATLGVAATTALHTMSRLTRHKDAHIAMRAAEALLERAGMGNSTRAVAVADGSLAQGFAFAFTRPEPK